MKQKQRPKAHDFSHFQLAGSDNLFFFQPVDPYRWGPQMILTFVTAPQHQMKVSWKVIASSYDNKAEKGNNKKLWFWSFSAFLAVLGTHWEPLEGPSEAPIPNFLIFILLCQILFKQDHFQSFLSICYEIMKKIIWKLPLPMVL